jgi:hypothetical protein
MEYNELFYLRTIFPFGSGSTKGFNPGSAMKSFLNYLALTFFVGNRTARPEYHRNGQFLTGDVVEWDYEYHSNPFIESSTEDDLSDNSDYQRNIIGKTVQKIIFSMMIDEIEIEEDGDSEYLGNLSLTSQHHYSVNKGSEEFNSCLSWTQATTISCNNRIQFVYHLIVKEEKSHFPMSHIETKVNCNEVNPVYICNKFGRRIRAVSPDLLGYP